MNFTELLEREKFRQRSNSLCRRLARKIKWLCKIIWQRRSSHHAVVRKEKGREEKKGKTKGDDVACIVCVRNIQPDGAKRMPSSLCG